MKKFLFTLVIALGLTQTTQAQVGCDMMNLSVNVSDTGLVKLYHPGNYLTWPSNANVLEWKITDAQGNIIAEDTLIDAGGFLFYHNIPITDTMNVTSLLTNDVAGIACLIEDQLYWEEGVYPSGTTWGRWEFVYGNMGGNLSVDQIEPATASVYPNPSTGAFKIDVIQGNISNLKIYSTTGKLVYSETNIASSEMLQLNQPAGLYLVVMQIEDEVKVAKLLLKK